MTVSPNPEPNTLLGNDDKEELTQIIDDRTTEPQPNAPSDDDDNDNEDLTHEIEPPNQTRLSAKMTS
jgi:hypothetical protein